MNKLAMSDFAKRALKRATKWYARERNIPGGLSSYQIEKKVMLEYSDDEWDSLKRLREADSTNIDLADDNGCNVGAFGAENGANGGELVEEAV